MPKRGAAKQITKDGREGSDDEEEEEQVEQQTVAPEDRPKKGMPKRGAGGPKPFGVAAPGAAPTPAPSTGGFGFSNTAPPAAAAAAAPASGGFSFLNKSGASTPFSVPDASPAYEASNPGATFAGFGNFAAQNAAPKPSVSSAFAFGAPASSTGATFGAAPAAPANKPATFSLGQGAASAAPKPATGFAFNSFKPTMGSSAGTGTDFASNAATTGGKDAPSAFGPGASAKWDSAGKHEDGGDKDKDTGADASAPSAFGSAPAKPFGTAQPPATSFGFGSSTTAGATPKPASTGFAFGAPVATAGEAPKSAASFAFGSSKPAEAPKPASTGFSFGAPAAAASDASKATPIFGFGSGKPAEAPKPASSGFAFGGPPAASASKADAPAPAPSKFSFGAPPSNTTSTPSPAPAAATKESAPAPPSATPASSGSSFGSATATNGSTTNGTAHAPAKRAAAEMDDEPSAGEVAYYTAIRGLNVSISGFIAKLVKDDPFTDLTQILPSLGAQYGKYLDEAATKNGWRPAGAAAGASSSAGTGAATPAPAAAPPAAMPKPPTFAPPAAGSFSLTAVPRTSASSTAPLGGGFTPSLPAASTAPSSSPFTFGGFGAKPAAAPATSTPAKKASGVSDIVKDALAEADADTSSASAAKAEETSSTPFKFNAPSQPAPSSTSSEAKKPTTLFSFAPSGPLHASTPDSKTFTPSKNIEDASPAKLGKFGPDGSRPTLSFGGAKASPASSGTPAKPASFSFGAAPSGGSALFSIGATPPLGPHNSFPPPPSTGFAFGGPATTTFGAGPSAPQMAIPFGNRTASGISAADSVNSVSVEAGEAEEKTKEASKDLAMAGGAGEENEETLLESRAKLHAFEEVADGEKKDQETKEKKWVSKGLGIFRLKKNKGDGKRRLLMRTEGAGNVILNMALGASFSASAEGKAVVFTGFDISGQITRYRLQVKTEESAKTTTDKLMAEVEEIKKA